MSVMSRTRQVLLSFVPTSAYAMLACLLTWPLPLHLRTHLPGSPSGDLGVYVWNLWIFRHEILRHGRLPFSTDHIFADTGGADFSLHNYTPIAGALAAPLIDTLGVVGAFNVVLLVFMTLSGLGVFVLARRIGLGSAAAWARTRTGERGCSRLMQSPRTRAASLVVSRLSDICKTSRG